MSVAEPQKELRFTRAGQAVVFGIAAAACVMAGLVFFLVAPYRADTPELPHPAWGLVPIGIALLLVWLAVHCAKHAYVLLSPIGVEIFPFFRPASNMQVIPWAQIAAADINDSRLTLHFSAEKTAGIHLSLSPISKDGRSLLAKAIQGRLPASPVASISDSPSPH
ncbi:hypothetical protein [Luteolibacter soli]|uniref:PH domain-containing protein n=1 Tax=Luteolibacter soli TaxID=3135280 RepID=A0ABU9AY08_9BACT